MGYKTKISKTLKTNEGYLAGSDKLRASELNKFFADDEVDAILCFGGGYGCTRILDLLDYDLIRKHPKLLIGFSDVTALHTAIGQNSRLVTIQWTYAQNFITKTYAIYDFFFLSWSPHVCSTRCFSTT